MLESRNFSFSVRKKDTEGADLCEWFQMYSIHHGVKLSYMIIEGLKLYKAKLEKSDGK